MAKQKGRDEVEELRGKLREVTKQNRELKKVLGRLQKKSHRVEELEEMFQELEHEEHVPEQKNVCSCGGKIEKIDLGIKYMNKCASCGKRETKKK